MSFHPAFAPLHARLTGLEPEMAQVGARHLAALYPVEVASYEPFLIDFYRVNTQLSVAEIGKVGSGFSLMTMTIAIEVLKGYSSDTYETAHPHFADLYVNREIKPLVLKLDALLAPRKAHIALLRQLSALMKVQYLLSHWDEEGFKRLKPPTQANFAIRLQELSAFFGAQAETATCANEVQLVSWA